MCRLTLMAGVILATVAGWVVAAMIKPTRCKPEGCRNNLLPQAQITGNSHPARRAGET